MEIVKESSLNNKVFLNEPYNPSQLQDDTYERLNQLFTEQDQQQRDILEAREILGDSAKDLSDSEVYDLINEVQFLVDSWLEEYERNVFDGKTLDEFLELEQK